MISTERHELWEAAAVNLFRDAAIPAVSLDRALGVGIYYEYCKTPHFKDRPLSDEWKCLLRQLAGPYGHTILKAYRIRKGLFP